MAKKMLKIFIKGFLQAIFVLVCMILCGVLGYFGSHYYFTNKKDGDGKKSTAEDIIADAQIDQISKNLIYVWDEDKGKITDCVLEVFNTEDSKMDYITIPTSGQVTISGDMYKKICLINSEMPQVFKLSKLCSYFDKDDDRAYGYGVLILEDYFNIDISYYTVVDSETFDEMFEAKEVEIDNNGDVDSENYSYSKDDKDDSSEDDDGEDPYAHDDSFVTKSYENVTTEATTQSGVTQATTEDVNATTTVKVKMVRADYLSKVTQYTDVDDLKEYVKDQCDKVKSNLEASQKADYAENYIKLTESDYRYHCIPGYYEGKDYVFNTSNAAKLFKNCNVNEKPADDTSSDDSTEEDVLEISDIVILNSTNTAGVAAGWSETLTEKGFNVIEVGNYSTTLTDTLIIVKEEGQGSELLRYFTNASIEVGTVPEDADAQIIIGTNDINH